MACGKRDHISWTPLQRQPLALKNSSQQNQNIGKTGPNHLAQVFLAHFNIWKYLFTRGLASNTLAWHFLFKVSYTIHVFKSVIKVIHCMWAHYHRCVIFPYWNPSKSQTMYLSQSAEQDHTKWISRSCSGFVCLVQRGCCGFVLHWHSLFLQHAPYLSILVLSVKPGFRETLSYFRRQQIVLSEEVKWHNWGWDFFVPENTLKMSLFSASLPLTLCRLHLATIR